MDGQVKYTGNPSQSEIKINYLLEENKLLKERVQDLEEIIKLNKKAFERSITLENHNKQEIAKNKKPSSNSLEEQIKFLKSLNDEITKENSYLNLKIEKLAKERDLAKDKALMSDQVANEFKRQEKETTNDYKTELLNLKKKIDEKDKKLKELQTGGIFRIKNVVSPEEKTMLFNSELEGYKTVLIKVYKRFALFKTQKEELIKLNQQFFNEIIKMKEILSLQSNLNQNQNLLINNNVFTATNQSLNLLEFHKKFYNLNEDDSSIEEISPLHSPLPLKVDQKNNSNKKNQEIPKLDINKAILIQEMNVNDKNRKNNGSELPQREVVLQASTNADRIKKIEAELKRTKKLLQNEMLENQSLKNQMSKIEEENISLKNKNKILVEAQKHFDAKLKKITSLLTIYKHSNKAYSKGQLNIPNIPGLSKIHNRNKSENNYNFLCVNLPSFNKFSTDSMALSNNNDLLSTDELNNRDIDLIETKIREQLMSDKESRRVVNLSLIDSEENKNDDFSERAQYIKFLQNMGIYLNQIYNNTNPSNFAKKRKFRSSSLILMTAPPKQPQGNNVLKKRPSNIYNNPCNEQNKYLSLRFDLKETMNKFTQKTNQYNVPNPRLERNLISPISKPNDDEKKDQMTSTLRKNYNNYSSNSPFHLSIGNLGNEEVFC